MPRVELDPLSISVCWVLHWTCVSSCHPLHVLWAKTIARQSIGTERTKSCCCWWMIFMCLHIQPLLRRGAKSLSGRRESSAITQFGKYFKF
ncbi:hypothetical protein V8F06_003025 [Rhypophila decipiens]